jgi:hypothetical protein
MSIHAFLGFHIHILELQLTFNYHLHLNRGRHEISFTENQYIFLQMKFDWKTFFFFYSFTEWWLEEISKENFRRGQFRTGHNENSGKTGKQIIW